MAKVSCTGPYSCSDSIQCHGNDCSVTCGGQASCQSGASSDAAIGEIRCTGAGSCDQQVYCQGNMCTLECGATACASDVCCTAASCRYMPASLRSKC